MTPNTAARTHGDHRRSYRRRRGLGEPAVRWRPVGGRLRCGSESLVSSSSVGHAWRLTRRTTRRRAAAPRRSRRRPPRRWRAAPTTRCRGRRTGGSRPLRRNRRAGGRRRACGHDAGAGRQRADGRQRERRHVLAGRVARLDHEVDPHPGTVGLVVDGGGEEAEARRDRSARRCARPARRSGWRRGVHDRDEVVEQAVERRAGVLEEVGGQRRAAPCPGRAAPAVSPRRDRAATRPAATRSVMAEPEGAPVVGQDGGEPGVVLGEAVEGVGALGEGGGQLRRWPR